MLALLAAMTVAAAPEPVAPGPRLSVLSPPPTAACKTHGTYQAGWESSVAQRNGRVAIHPLGQMPKANLERTVLRTIDGCAAPVIVGYSVGR